MKLVHNLIGIIGGGGGHMSMYLVPHYANEACTSICSEMTFVFLFPWMPVTTPKFGPHIEIQHIRLSYYDYFH